jgi:hypothetical protein
MAERNKGIKKMKMQSIKLLREIDNLNQLSCQFNKMAKRYISICVGGSWRTNVCFEEKAKWCDLKIEIKKATGIQTNYQKLTPTGKSDEICELEEGDDVFCDWELINGYHPLHFAAAHGNTEAIRSWLASGANANVTNAFEQTPLMLAACWFEDETVAELLCLGADAKLVDKNGCTALHHIAFGYDFNKDKMKKIAKMLTKAGCDPMARNKRNEILIDVAKRIRGHKLAMEVESWIKETNGEA